MLSLQRLALREPALDRQEEAYWSVFDLLDEVRGEEDGGGRGVSLRDDAAVSHGEGGSAALRLREGGSH